MEQQPIEEAIIIHPHLVQKFMKHGKDYANLLALYTFYIYHANLQKTNQPLATDEFTRKGMNWAIDRVKKTKRILKEMKVIEVVQKKQYSYIHLFFIYTKRKIAEIFGKNEVESKQEPTPIEKPVEKKEPIKTDSSDNITLEKWLNYCQHNHIRYNKNNLIHWSKKLEGRVTIEQKEAIYKSIENGWKNFYIIPIKESKYHKFLGKSLMMDRDCDTLIDIELKDEKFVYQFRNIKVTTGEPPSTLFERCGYDKLEVKNAPIVSTIKDRIRGVIQRF